MAIQRDKTEVFFRRMLKEDKGAGQWEGTNYVDFLCQIHRDIKELLNWDLCSVTILGFNDPQFLYHTILLIQQVYKLMINPTSMQIND